MRTLAMTSVSSKMTTDTLRRKFRLFLQDKFGTVNGKGFMLGIYIFWVHIILGREI